ncbi:hypothetical protein A2U01_0078218, partial [Trifolium medium]|nr:hypothetical protein [Trifolium medium]
MPVPKHSSVVKAYFSLSKTQPSLRGTSFEQASTIILFELSALKGRGSSSPYRVSR